MNKYLSLSVVIIITLLGYSRAQGDADNNRAHFFLLVVPESKIDSLRRRAARQEEGAGAAIGAIAEAAGPAANVGQILQGVLGGDLTPIFAGSTAFIPEGDFREGVTEVLQQTVAPAIQRILMEFNKNVQRHFNSTSTTPRSSQPQTQQPIINQNANSQFQQPNYNNFNNPYQQQPGVFQQQNFNQFQQPNQQFGGGAVGAGGIGAGSVGAGGSTFNNQYNPNFQQNPLYQQQGYPNNQLQQQPGFANNQLGSNQFQPQNNIPVRNHYNQYQQPPPVNTNANFNQQFQGPLQNTQPTFGNQITPPQQTQFQPPPQAFPQPINSNHINNPQQYVPRGPPIEK